MTEATAPHPPSPPSALQVRDMSTDPELSKLHQLVDIFSHKTLEAYLAFQASHGAYLAELGVDGAASEETMRLLTLCTLAGAADTLTYDAVAAALKVRASHVRALPSLPRPLSCARAEDYNVEFLVSERRPSGPLEHILLIDTHEARSKACLPLRLSLLLSRPYTSAPTPPSPPPPCVRALPVQVAPSDVEGWVVRSISIGLMDARMDQQTKSLSILRTVQREFSTSQWKDLQRKLQAWRENVSAMSVTLDRRG